MLRKVLRQGAPAKLVGRGRRRGFRRILDQQRAGRMMRGLTHLLQDRIFSQGSIPALARRTSTARRDGRYFRGKSAGFKRGRAVDAQLSAIAEGRKPPGPKPANQKAVKGASKKVVLYHLTNVALHALSAANLQLVRGQQPVVSDASNVASAADLVAVRTVEGSSLPEDAESPAPANQRELVLIELKTGYDQGRLAPVMLRGGCQKLRGPLNRAVDCVNHRHLAQLAATVHMFRSDRRLMQRLGEIGIHRVTGALLYVTDDDTELQELGDWWAQRAGKMIKALA